MSHQTRLPETFDAPEAASLLACDHLDSYRVLLALDEIMPIIHPSYEPWIREQHILVLADDLALYGPDAAKLHKICDENIAKTATVMFSWRLGLTSRAAIQHAISTGNHDRALDVNALVRSVQQQETQYALIVPMPPADMSPRQSALALFRHTPAP